MQYSCNFNKSGICRVIRLELQLSLIHEAAYIPSSLQQNAKKKKPPIRAHIGPKRHTTCFHKDKQENKTPRKTKLQTSVTLTIRIPPRYSISSGVIKQKKKPERNNVPGTVISLRECKTEAKWRWKQWNGNDQTHKQQQEQRAGTANKAAQVETGRGKGGPKKKKNSRCCSNFEPCGQHPSAGNYV